MPCSLFGASRQEHFEMAPGLHDAGAEEDQAITDDDTPLYAAPPGSPSGRLLGRPRDASPDHLDVVRFP